MQQTNGSNGPGITIIPNPKMIVFCIHGMGGNANNFDGFKETAQKVAKDNFSFLGRKLKPTTTVKDIEIAVRYAAIHNDKILCINVEFSNNKDYVTNQAEELNTMINTVYEVFSSNSRYSLMGHSKGGLVAIEYINRYGYLRKIEKILTFGTPYNHEILNDGADNFALDKTIGNKILMEEIRNDWNSLSSSYRPTVYAVGSCVWTLDIIGMFFGYPHWFDEAVSIENAMGKNYTAINGIKWEKYYNNSYSHRNMLNTSSTVYEIIKRLS